MDKIDKAVDDIFNQPEQTEEDLVVISADWKDIEGAFEEILTQLPKLGLFVYETPSLEGSDQYAVIVSKKKFNTAEEAEVAAGFPVGEEEEGYEDEGYEDED